MAKNLYDELHRRIEKGSKENTERSFKDVAFC